MSMIFIRPPLLSIAHSTVAAAQPRPRYSRERRVWHDRSPLSRGPARYSPRVRRHHALHPTPGSLIGRAVARAEDRRVPRGAGKLVDGMARAGTMPAEISRSAVAELRNL